MRSLSESPSPAPAPAPREEPSLLPHEPLLVVLGHRGRRVKDVLGSRATRRLAALGAAAAVCGVAALVLSPPAARLAALAPAALALPVAPLVARRLEKTTAGELLVAAALSACAAPVALAAGAPAAWEIGRASCRERV